MHNYGLAFDVAVMVNGKISWDEKLYRGLGKYDAGTARLQCIPDEGDRAAAPGATQGGGEA